MNGLVLQDLEFETDPELKTLNPLPLEELQNYGERDLQNLKRDIQKLEGKKMVKY
jgi:hypothetical protein